MVKRDYNSLKQPDQLIRYWQQQLAGISPLLELPVDKPRPSLSTGQTETQQFFLAASLVKSLDLIAQAQDVEIFTILLAAFKVLIYRYADRSDILIGTAPNIVDQSISEYFNYVVLRTDISGNPSFLAVLDRVNRVRETSYEHQGLSFDQLVESLSIELSASYHPLVQVIFNWTDCRSDCSIEIAPLSSPVLTTAARNPIDLTLKLTHTEIGISGYFEYNLDLFDPATIERMVLHFQTLLGGIVANPQQPIDRLPLLTDPERQQLLTEWNHTQTHYPNLCIHQLFEAQVDWTPDNIAVVFDDQQITYQELNHRANQLANYLRKLGVTADVPVGICLERSMAMMIGLLGILKAGGAYVPLDPSYPQDRLAYMLTNSQVKVLISSDQFEAILPKFDGDRVSLTSDQAKIALESAENLTSQVQLDNLGYIIYTSGSTGLPKGVAMTQRSLCNLIAWQLTQPMASEHTKTLQFTPISFDVSFQEIFSTWCSGGTLVLVTDEIRRDPFELLSLLDRAAINRLFLPFVALQQLAEVAVNHQLFPPQLKSVITAGEQLQITPAIRQFFGNLVDCTLHNHYGPSESHVVTALTLTAPVENWEALPPIGKPIANTQMYVLDAQMQVVPIGITGELYIGGDCLARGYFQRPELTAEKFIPNPFDFTSQPSAQSKLYKTGDLVRYRRDGNIEYLGRIDNQVKIRGFRIELGEIETLLNLHPAISQTTVIVREDSPGNKQLVAYCVTTTAQQASISDQSLAIDELRSFMAQKVPNYMVPAFFVLLTSLPMTPSGKVDRRALPVPDYTRQGSATTFVAPADRIEIELTEIWQQVLNIKSIGSQDNFFELGGNSLLAVRILGAISQLWHQKLPLTAFITAPTITEFANLLRQEPASISWSTLVPIKSHGSKPPLFCIHPVGGNILEYYPLAHHLDADRPIYGLQSLGLEGNQAPLTRIEAMAAHYIQEIKTVQPDGPYFLLGYSLGGLIAFEIACQLVKQNDKIDLLVLLDQESPTLVETRPSLLRTLMIHVQNLVQLTFTEQITYLKDRILFRTVYQDSGDQAREFLIKKWAEQLSPESLQVLEANFQAIQNYTGAVYPGTVTLFRSSIQPISQAISPDLGWGDLVEGEVKICDIRGYHANLLKQPQVEFVAQKLKSCLDRSVVSQ